MGSIQDPKNRYYVTQQTQPLSYALQNTHRLQPADLFGAVVHPFPFNRSRFVHQGASGNLSTRSRGCALLKFFPYIPPITINRNKFPGLCRCRLMPLWMHLPYSEASSNHPKIRSKKREGGHSNKHQYNTVSQSSSPPDTGLQHSGKEKLSCEPSIEDRHQPDGWAVYAAHGCHRQRCETQPDVI